VRPHLVGVARRDARQQSVLALGAGDEYEPHRLAIGAGGAEQSIRNASSIFSCDTGLSCQYEKVRASSNNCANISVSVATPHPCIRMSDPIVVSRKGNANREPAGYPAPRAKAAPNLGEEICDRLRKRDGVAYITLNNPEKANILDKPTSDAISEAWIDLWEDRAIRLRHIDRRR